MVRWLAGLTLTVVAAVAAAAETGVHVTITGLPALPAGSGPVKLTEALGHMMAQASAPSPGRLEVRIGESQAREEQQTILRVLGPATFVSGSTVASF